MADPWVPIDIDPKTFLVGVKANLVSWLDYHLNIHEDFAGYWANMPKGGPGTLEVVTGFPQEAPEDALSRPRVRIRKTGDVKSYTNGTDDEVNCELEKHELSFEIAVLTDEGTGAATGNTGVASAVEWTWAQYRQELEDIGLVTVRLSGGSEGIEFGCVVTRMNLEVNYYLQGKATTTISLALATAQVIAQGQITWQSIRALTIPQVLRLKTLTGVQMRNTTVTVTAKNQAGVEKQLRGTIMVGLPAGSYIVLTPVVAAPGETYKEVTAMTIGAQDGTTGLKFEVRNVPQTV